MSKIYLCDGYDNCNDKSDELDANCERQCGDADEFLCKNKRRCISTNWKCDGDRDCPDNSDELDCPKVNATCPGDQHRCSDGKVWVLRDECRSADSS